MYGDRGSSPKEWIDAFLVKVGWLPKEWVGMFSFSHKIAVLEYRVPWPGTN